MAPLAALDAVQRARRASDAIESVKTWLPDAHAMDDAMRRARVSAESAPAVNERAREATAQRERGNAAYREGKYAAAIEHYDASCAIERNAAALANRAMCWLKLEKWDAAEADCTSALALDAVAFGVKAYQRRGMARRELGKYLESTMDFEEALRLEPTSKILKEERAKSQRAFELEAKIRPTQARVKIPVEHDRAVERGDDSLVDVDMGAVEDAASCARDSVETRRRAAPASAPATGRDEDLVSKASAIAASKPIVAPRNGAEFERAYRREMKAAASTTSASRRAEILTLVPPDKMATLFAGGLDPDILADVATIALEHWYAKDESASAALEWLERLRTVPRFAVSAALRPSASSRALERAFAAACATAARDARATARLEALRESFRVLA